MKKIKAILVVAALMMPHISHADMLGVYAGAGSWYHTSEGTLNHLGSDADLEKDFGFEDSFSTFVYIAVEHPFPLIPNIRISQYSVETTGNKAVTASSEFSFAGSAYSNGMAITTELRWDEQDALLYYEFLDNIVSFDLGLGAKKVDGEIAVTASGTTNTLRIEETLPITYVMAAVAIPGTGISISIDKTQSFAGDSVVKQTNTKISYEIAYTLGVEAGYRTSSVNLDDINGVVGEMKLTGPFVNLLFHF